ncbi:LANO_0F11826g1_1 [Lachancea nothofagi CBS 11611]|uniref:LANO_0F11826g1_1 n=1 Tax=Lachancea nothofagi CBS 11611 TaxID=1266666 RepID=A0A1G4KB11_9SACH|nr:LANO_0F11826g1_1 [Lachancea nothofagi CBS 11611]
MNGSANGKSRTPKLGQLETNFGNEMKRFGSQESLGETEPGKLFITITEYNKRMEDELDMKPGDKIRVITDDEEYNDGWYYGRNLRTQEEGLYPKVFTQEISTPSLVRAKSARRVASPLANGSTTDLSTFSNDGSTSELPTPHPLETAAPVKLSLDRSASVKVTMRDIDKALEDFRGDTLTAGTLQPGNREDMNTTTTTTDSDTDMSRQHILRSSNSVHSLTNDTSFGSTSINGIDTKELTPLNAQNWTPEQVTAYFIGSGFDVESSSRFQQHKISGTILLELELAHLKELDINSFGIRFEIYKEIEAIKDVINTKDPVRLPSQLMPAAAVNQRSYMGHTRKTSQSLEDLPTKHSTVDPSASQSRTGSKHRPYSLVLNGRESASQGPEKVVASMGSYDDKKKAQPTKPQIDDNHFLSPRRAPKPPSYPSPVQPPKSPITQSFTPSPSIASFAQNARNGAPTIFERATHMESRPNTTSELQTPSFQFPKTTPPQLLSDTPEGNENAELEHTKNLNVIQPSDNYAGNRSSVIYSGQQGHKKAKSGGSFADIFNRISLMSPGAPRATQSDFEGLALEESQLQRPSSSIYEHSRTASPSHIKHPSQVTAEIKRHRRNSSILSFFSNKGEENVKSPTKKNGSRHASVSHSRKNSAMSYNASRPFSPEKGSRSPNKRHSVLVSPVVAPISPVDESLTTEEKRRSVSAKEPSSNLATTDSDLFYDAKEDTLDDTKNKRSVSEAVKPKSTRSKSSKNLPRKMKTSAFMEGIRTISVMDAMTESDCSGWMSKKGSGAMGVWKNRFFTLHGTRLSYFSSTTDTRERGLIDITAHRVLPAKEDDKLVALYAASTGKGRYCFKLLPPQPGSKKGLTFTQPRVHYFAVDTKEEMRAWMAALIKATIDIDTSVPIISSCATPTVSLNRAQEMLSQAREETRQREEQRFLNEEDEDQMLWEQQQRAEHSLNEGSTDGSAPSSTVQVNSSTNSGFHSPYLLASGVLSPGTPQNNGRLPDQQNNDYFLLGSKYSSNKI